jgi:DNA-binding transcriptional ArsR family regulator
MPRTDEVFEIEDVRIFEVLNSPVRLRILRCLEEPRSVKDIATRLGVPPTRLYYHVNMLADAGIVEVVETRKVGAMVEKLYLRKAGNFRPSPRLVEQGHDPADLARIGASLVLDGARVDTETALRSHFERQVRGEGPDELKGTLGRTIAYLEPEDIRRVEEALGRLGDLLAELDRKEGGTEFGLTYAFFPVAGGGERE